MNNIILNIQDYLPQLSSVEDQSITRLISSLEKRKGIYGIELLNHPSRPISLSIKHDISIITASQIKQITHTIANNLNRIFGHLLVKASDLYENYNPQLITVFLKNCAGVTYIFTEPSGWINLEFNRYITEETRLIECINKNK